MAAWWGGFSLALPALLPHHNSRSWTAAVAAVVAWGAVAPVLHCKTPLARFLFGMAGIFKALRLLGLLFVVSPSSAESWQSRTLAVWGYYPADRLRRSLSKRRRISDWLWSLAQASANLGAAWICHWLMSFLRTLAAVAVPPSSVWPWRAGGGRRRTALAAFAWLVLGVAQLVFGMAALSAGAGAHLRLLGLEPGQEALHKPMQLLLDTRGWRRRPLRAFWSVHWNQPMRVLLVESTSWLVGESHHWVVWIPSGLWHTYGVWLFYGGVPWQAVRWRLVSMAMFFAMQPLLLWVEGWMEKTRRCRWVAAVLGLASTPLFVVPALW